ncbi:MAG: alpha/beta fold hydrolase [Anaerolineae bacterium]
MAAHGITIKLEPCLLGKATAKCHAYRVYENRSTRAGRQIDLNIAVPAATDHVEPDPLFYFTGGPGGAATDVAAMLKADFVELNKTRDIVLIDQRGAGGSNMLMCPKPDKPFDISDVGVSAYVTTCLTGLDADPRWYTTRAYVDDVNEVRQALGYDKINISGGSYGRDCGADLPVAASRDGARGPYQQQYTNRLSHLRASRRQQPTRPRSGV